MEGTISKSTWSKRPTVAPQMVTLRDLAGLLDISYTTAHELAQRGELPVPGVKIGRQYRFAKSAVDRFLGTEAPSD